MLVQARLLWVPTDLTLWPWLWCLTNIMKSLTMPISFNSIFYDFDTLHECFLWQILLMGINWFDLVTLTYIFDFLTENLNLGCIFRIVCTRTLIFYMSDEWSSHESKQIWPCDLNLDAWPTYWKLTLGITFQSYVPWHGSLRQILSMAYVVTAFDPCFKNFYVGMAVSGICHSHGHLCFIRTSCFLENHEKCGVQLRSAYVI